LTRKEVLPQSAAQATILARLPTKAHTY
jgi:hypothetical protein